LAASWSSGKRGGVLNFATRRVLRIYPGFLVCVLACVFLVGPMSGVDIGPYFRNPATYQLLRYLYFGPFMDAVPGGFARNPLAGLVDTSLWSIKFEVYCYVLLILAGVARLLRPAPTLALATASMAGYAVIFLSGRHFGHGLDLWYMPRLATCFFCGSAAYLNRARVPMHPGLFAAAVALTVAAVRLPPWACLVLPTAGLYALLYVACLRCPPVYAVGRRTDLSYGVYLYAFPIQQLLIAHGWGVGSPWVLTALTLPLVVGIAWLSWTFVERPALRAKPAVIGRQWMVPERSPVVAQP
jgi:peptidoglycan/LPS O-acetylase OafA/YrhL